MIGDCAELSHKLVCCNVHAILAPVAAPIKGDFRPAVTQPEPGLLALANQEAVSDNELLREFFHARHMFKYSRAEISGNHNPTIHSALATAWKRTTHDNESSWTEKLSMPKQTATNHAHD